MSSGFRYVHRVAAELMEYFSPSRLGNKRNPFNELVYIMLSSSTPPDRYQRVYRAVRRRYRTAEQFAKARPASLARIMRAGGLQNRKAKAIVSIARRLRAVFGRVTLSPLARMSNEEAEAFLVSLPEISTKAARCILLYSLGREVFPVDRHCFRICQRLGWIPASRTLTESTADFIQRGIPGELRLHLHVGMVLLGRTNCLPRNPRCQECPLLASCPTGPRLLV